MYYNQLTSIDHDDNILSNPISKADSCKNEALIVHDASSLISKGTTSNGGTKRSHIWFMTDLRQISQNLSFQLSNWSL
jgi:hypothetical protein